MFKHTTKQTVSFGLLLGLTMFAVQYFIFDMMASGIMMAIFFFIWAGFLTPHIEGEQRKTREKRERRKRMRGGITNHEPTD